MSKAYQCHAVILVIKAMQRKALSCPSFNKALYKHTFKNMHKTIYLCYQIMSLVTGLWTRCDKTTYILWYFTMNHFRLVLPTCTQGSRPTLNYIFYRLIFLFKITSKLPVSLPGKNREHSTCEMRHSSTRRAARFCEISSAILMFHDDVIKWKPFPRYWPFVRGIHRSPVNSPHKGQWRGALVFSLICVWINGLVNNREAGELRRYRAHYDVIVMHQIKRNTRKNC